MEKKKDFDQNYTERNEYSNFYHSLFIYLISYSPQLQQTPKGSNDSGGHSCILYREL